MDTKQPDEHGTMNQNDREQSIRMSEEIRGFSERLGQIESTNRRLWEAFSHDREDRGKLAETMRHMMVVVDRLASKVDSLADRRPNMIGIASGLIAFAALFVSIGVLAFAPVYRELGRNAGFHDMVAGELNRRLEIIGGARQQLTDHSERLVRLEDRVYEIERTGWSREDHQRSYDGIRRDMNEIDDRLWQIRRRDD